MKGAHRNQKPPGRAVSGDGEHRTAAHSHFNRYVSGCQHTATNQVVRNLTELAQLAHDRALVWFASQNWREYARALAIHYAARHRLELGRDD